MKIGRNCSSDHCIQILVRFSASWNVFHSQHFGATSSKWWVSIFLCYLGNRWYLGRLQVWCQWTEMFRRMQKLSLRSVWDGSVKSVLLLTQFNGANKSTDFTDRSRLTLVTISTSTRIKLLSYLSICLKYVFLEEYILNVWQFFCRLYSSKQKLIITEMVNDKM